MTVPIFISFYAGRRYYYDAAEQLRADLEALSIPHDIEEVAPPADRDWADICRMKPAFIQRTLEQHRRPVFWLDVVSRVLKRPTVLEGLRGDFAAFLRGFSRLQDFDPVQRGRTFVPGFLFFNYSEGARRLAAQAAEMEATSEVRATDDYFLEEAWRAFEGHLDVTLLSPAGIDLGKPNAAPVEDPWLQVGLSGSVLPVSVPRSSKWRIISPENRCPGGAIPPIFALRSVRHGPLRFAPPVSGGCHRCWAQMGKPEEGLRA